MGAAVLAEAAEASRWLVLLSPEVNHNDAADSISGSLLFKARLVVVVVVARGGAGSWWLLHLPRNEIGFAQGVVVRGRGGTTSKKAWILDSVNKAAAKRTSPSAAFLECATANKGIIPVCVYACVGRAAKASLVGRRGKSDGQQQYSAVTSFCVRDQPILSRVLY